MGPLIEDGEAMKFDILVDETECQTAKYFCFAAEMERYDFTIFYSQRFFGKQIVISLQNGQMVLMSSEDIEHPEIWANKFSVHPSDVKHVQEFFHMVLDREPTLEAQY